MTTKNPMGEEKPVITTGIGRAKGAYRTLPMPSTSRSLPSSSSWASS